MLGKHYTYDEKPISLKSENFQVGITNVVWHNLTTSDSKIEIESMHGAISSPTFSKGRMIEIEGLIDSNSRKETRKAMDYLEDLFALQPNNILTNSFKKFGLTDELNREWIIDAKVENTIEYQTEEDDYIDGSIRYFRIVLFAPNPVFYSKNTLKIKTKEGQSGGFKLPVILPTSFSESNNSVIIQNEGNYPSPIIFKIKVKNTIQAPLKIENRTNGTFFALDVKSTQIGDEIIINGFDYTVTLNGTNILKDRLLGSKWQTVKGETLLLIYDGHVDVGEKAFEVEILFNNAML